MKTETSDVQDENALAAIFFSFESGTKVTEKSELQSAK
jgi:hypothetical protein